MLPADEKRAVRSFWEEAPCGTRELTANGESVRYDEVERIRKEREPFIEQFANFSGASGKELLEVGVGAGTDHLRFARAGAHCHGVDLTDAALEMTRIRLAAEGLSSNLVRTDAEVLPFDDDTFDVVYSWGVIHHTPDTRSAAQEIVRVLKPGGRFCVMVYNRHSLVALQAWAVFGLARGRPFLSLARAIAENVESSGTKAYTRGEAAQLFAGSTRVEVETLVTAYDLRVGRRRFLPRWTWRIPPQRLGWFHVVTGVK